MPELEFAFWDNIRPPTAGGSYADVYQQHISLAKQVEALGWTAYFVIEHQNRPTDIVTCPSVYLTAVARETDSLRIGTMMWQLPFYNPMRLAQEVAMLDQLSRGRVEFGSGIGVHEHEFMRWGVDYYKRAAISDEVMKIVKMAWTQEEVTFSGDFFHFDEALPSPKPFQMPYPPIWVAGHSDASMEFAARNGYNIAKNSDTDDVVAGKFDLYRKVWADCGHQGAPPRLFLQRSVHVAETDEKAHEEARQYLATGKSRFEGGPIANTRIGWGSHGRGMGSDSERPDNKARGETIASAAKSYEFNIEQGLAIVGSPATVARRIREGQQKMGYTVFCTVHQMGDMPEPLVTKSIELFGNEVIPTFGAVHAS